MTFYNYWPRNLSMNEFIWIYDCVLILPTTKGDLSSVLQTCDCVVIDRSSDSFFPPSVFTWVNTGLDPFLYSHINRKGRIRFMWTSIKGSCVCVYHLENSKTHDVSLNTFHTLYNFSIVSQVPWSGESTMLTYTVSVWGENKGPLTQFDQLE